MRRLPYSAYEMAQRLIGIQEVPGVVSNPLVLAMLKQDADWPADDSVPWCSGFVNFIAKLMGLQRSRSLAARSWLLIGQHVTPEEAELGFDIVILRRGSSPTAGHVGFFGGWSGLDRVMLLGGNQSDSVSLASFPRADILGIRRLA